MIQMGENIKKMAQMRSNPLVQYSQIFPPYDFFLKEIGNYQETHPGSFLPFIYFLIAF